MVCPVSSKILHLPMVSSQPSTSQSSDSADPALLEINQELELRSKNLSSTLHKLYLWEKKLYEEVKVITVCCIIFLNFPSYYFFFLVLLEQLWLLYYAWLLIGGLWSVVPCTFSKNAFKELDGPLYTFNSTSIFSVRQ